MCRSSLWTTKRPRRSTTRTVRARAAAAILYTTFVVYHVCCIPCSLYTTFVVHTVRCLPLGSRAAARARTLGLVYSDRVYYQHRGHAQVVPRDEQRVGPVAGLARGVGLRRRQEHELPGRVFAHAAAGRGVPRRVSVGRRSVRGAAQLRLDELRVDLDWLGERARDGDPRRFRLLVVQERRGALEVRVV